MRAIFLSSMMLLLFMRAEGVHADGGYNWEAGETGEYAGEKLFSSMVECSGGSSLAIDADIRGSVKTMFSGNSTVGKVELNIENFLRIFPEESRMEAFKLYTDCLAKKFPTSKSGISIYAPSKPLVFQDVNGKPRIIISGRLDYFANEIVYSIRGEDNCALVVIPEGDIEIPISVKIQKLKKDGQLWPGYMVTLLPGGESYGDLKGSVEPESIFFVSVAPIDPSFSGRFSFMIGRYC